MSNLKFPLVGDVYCNSLGADPELFMLKGPRTILAPTVELLKHISGDACKMHADGAQLELQPRPSCCRGAVMDSIRTGLCLAFNLATANKATLSVKPTVVLSKGCLKTLPAAAQVFGCDPDWSAYTAAMNAVEIDASTHMYRYAGGHIHLGGRIDHIYVPAAILLTDLLVGVPMTAMTADPAPSRKRRKCFGHAGCFRVQPHGYEYRTPDNIWLQHPKLAYLFLGLARSAARILSSRPDKAKAFVEEYSSLARDIINEVDVEAAKTLWAELAPQLKGLASEMGWKGESSLNSPTGDSELIWADELLAKYEERVKPELTKPLYELWGMAAPAKLQGYYHSVGGFSDKDWQHFHHGGFSRGGFEEFFNPAIGKMYDWCYANKKAYWNYDAKQFG